MLVMEVYLTRCLQLARASRAAREGRRFDSDILHNSETSSNVSGGVFGYRNQLRARASHAAREGRRFDSDILHEGFIIE
jgi:hypothetical protein